MNSRNLIYILIFSFCLSSCNSGKKPAEVASYKYEEENIKMNPEFKKIVPDWVKVGKVCYGLVVQLNADGSEVKGKPVKAKVVQINSNHIKMKALERVSLAKSEKCDKMGILKGEIWEEKAGDFYLTKGEAITKLKEKNLYFDRATVD